MEKATGRVIQVQGSVVDVEFPEGELPDVFEALEFRAKLVERWFGGGKALGLNRVRCVSMDTTDGLQRGVPAVATGSPSWCRWDP